jgi:7-cyano-7-deazaguanine reductase
MTDRTPKGQAVPGSDYTRHTPLGKNTPATEGYAPELLCPLPRQPGREALGIAASALPFSGVDIWNLYELSWLNARGLPQAATGQLTVPCDSVNLVESKSLKLYLNALNQTRFDSMAAVSATIERDLTACCGSPVALRLSALNEQPEHHPSAGVAGECLDGLDVSPEHFTPDPGVLQARGEPRSERLYTNLFRSLCPVTDQPDWATMIIQYQGPAIDRESLLHYLVSFRRHNGFHEQCVETVFAHIQERCQPKVLSVYAAFLRRGGIDINPLRTNDPHPPRFGRLERQ